MQPAGCSLGADGRTKAWRSVGPQQVEPSDSWANLLPPSEGMCELAPGQRCCLGGRRAWRALCGVCWSGRRRRPAPAPSPGAGAEVRPPRKLGEASDHTVTLSARRCVPSTALKAPAEALRWPVLPQSAQSPPTAGRRGGRELFCRRFFVTCSEARPRRP